MHRRPFFLATVALLALVALAPTTVAAAGSVDLDFPGATVDEWHGHARRRFQFEGAEAWVVVPATPLPGNPWNWCLMFPDAFTVRCAALALVARGFHHAFLDVGNTLGGPAAVAKLARFHEKHVRRWPGRGRRQEGKKGAPATGPKCRSSPGRSSDLVLVAVDVRHHPLRGLVA